jgi:protein-tyrosine phosphatase
MSKPVRVLFVCLGNICRSPTVEGIFRAQAEKSGWGSMFEVDSAGIVGSHAGEPPDRRAQRYAHERGYDLSGLRARQIGPHDFEAFDYVLAMDKPVLESLQRLQKFSRQPRAEVALFLDYHGSLDGNEVPDPYYSDAAAFENVLDLAEEGSTALLRHLLKKQGVFGCEC